MYKLCFVILHYQALNETIDCVTSIEENISYPNYAIVIVDNHSPNKSGEKLKEYYSKDNNVFILLSEENSGFARGNNLGYQFAKKHLSADFIACINNDTIVRDEQFIQKIVDLYDREKFHLMGPDIITLDGKHQNPMKMRAITLEEVNDYLSNFKRNRDIAILKARLKKITILTKVVRLVKKPKRQDSNYLKQHEDIVLHGSALVFSPLYIENEAYAFHPDTFMFAEEYILYYLCKSKGYKILYSPVTNILHKEDASTDSVTKTNVNKLKFIYKHERNSYLILKGILENMARDGNK